MDKKNSPEAERELPPQTAHVSRRDLLYVIGATPALAGISRADAQPAASDQQATAQKAKFERKVFNDQQWRTVGVLCDLIIPADERSGSATQASVPEFIDDWIAFQKQENGSDHEEAQILGGLMWLDRESNARFDKSFADAAPDQQKQILDRVAWPAKAAPEDRVWVLFFNEFRDLTVSGFFSSKMGVADLPYLGNTAVTKWEGCPPKVWTIIEDRMKNGFNDITREARAAKS
ncbi:MAG: gluconate 2-dehydrogenase subunit 3 family protein [Acidobacteriaceae bacterium]|nr:gluconate 2-dehydrogenase subunit 3 family protein [Acidobacteriaceae bacterium]MBV9782104.1 gluconate 2-dehydrogenase subunit 3 family protein [Acidobacteriaceae bacterium]